MAQTNPTPIPASPAAPDRADRVTFSSKATAWADWVKTQGAPGMNTIATQTYNNAVDAYGSANTANNWAIKNDAAVSGSDWSAYAYAVGAAPTGSAKDWATKATTVAAGEFSARAYAVGTPTDGSSKDWATKPTTVASGEFSARAYAVGAPTDGSSKDWATKTGTKVDASEYSAKEYAQGTNATGGTAKQWATSTGVVDNGEKGAKGYAQDAAASAASALNAPGTSATSTTSLTIGAGTQNLTIQTNKAFSVGQFVVIANTPQPDNYMAGQITAHNPVTGDLTVTTKLYGGTGTFTAWTIALTGDTNAALPNQVGHTGKFLTTNGTSASWAYVMQPPSMALSVI